METQEGTVAAPTQERVTVVEKGPKIIDLDLDGRENQVRSIEIDPITFKPKERTFAEKEGIEDLIGFVDTVIETADKSGDPQMEETARLFKENLVFIGEKELKKATKGIAQHLLQEAKKGKDIIIFPAHIRSERYISLRILEEIDLLTEEDQQLRSRIKLTESAKQATEIAQKSTGNCLVAVPDDFVFSGFKIKGCAMRIYDKLLQAGFSSDKAFEMIEAEVITLPQRSGGKLTPGKEDKDLNFFSYYQVPEYRGKDGTQVVHTGISVTGSHTSTDYGFDMELKEFHQFLRKEGVDRKLPLLHEVVKPYEMTDESPRKYKDSALQGRWERMETKYGIKIPSENKPS